MSTMMRQFFFWSYALTKIVNKRSIDNQWVASGYSSLIYGHHHMNIGVYLRMMLLGLWHAVKSCYVWEILTKYSKFLKNIEIYRWLFSTHSFYSFLPLWALHFLNWIP